MILITQSIQSQSSCFFSPLQLAKEMGTFSRRYRLVINMLFLFLSRKVLEKGLISFNPVAMSIALCRIWFGTITLSWVCFVCEWLCCVCIVIVIVKCQKTAEIAPMYQNQNQMVKDFYCSFSDDFPKIFNKTLWFRTIEKQNKVLFQEHF